MANSTPAASFDGSATMTDHRHLWHEDAAGEVHCAFVSFDAEPTEPEAAEAIADAETRAAIRVELDWRPISGAA